MLRFLLITLAILVSLAAPVYAQEGEVIGSSPVMDVNDEYIGCILYLADGSSELMFDILEVDCPNLPPQ